MRRGMPSGVSGWRQRSGVSPLDRMPPWDNKVTDTELAAVLKRLQSAPGASPARTPREPVPDAAAGAGVRGGSGSRGGRGAGTALRGLPIRRRRVEYQDERALAL